MRTFLIVLGILALFVSPIPMISIAAVAVCFGSIGIIDAIERLRADTVRIYNIQSIEQKQRDLAQVGK